MECGDDNCPKDDLLWGSIARLIYSGIAAYVITLLIAFLRDFSRNRNIAASARNYASILRAYAKFSSHYRDTNIFLYVELLRLISNLVICVLYVVGTYKRDVPVYTSIVYRVCGCFFVLDNIFYLLVSESAISVVTSYPVIIDAFSFPSLILSDSELYYLNFAYLRAVSAYSAFSRFERRGLVRTASKRILLIKLSFQTLALFYTLSATIQLLEIPGDLLSPAFRDEWDAYGQWTFMNSAYFIIVTLSTVGYGDFSPKTIQSRIYALFIIIIGIIVFSSVIANLVDQANQERGSGYFVKNSRTRHVIVTGNPNITELVHFVTEFYSDFRHSNIGAKVVVLVENPSWSDTEWYQYIARNQFLQSRLQFLSGSATNSSDLTRARIQSADAVFVLTSPSTGEIPYSTDTKTVMIILAIRNVRNDIPVYAQTLLEDSNLQTEIALSTIANASATLSNTQDVVVGEHPRYPGLYRSVVDFEMTNLPKKNFSRAARQYMELILNRNLNQRKQLIDSNKDSEGALSEALHISQHVCLQEIQVALISGNIRTNGIGTLLSNMYLDVPISKHTLDDPGWLFEYQMGANVNLMYGIIPDELDGVQIKDIAGDLYVAGLLVMAITDPTTMEPRPAIDTSVRLNGGDLVMLLSYLSHEHIIAALFLVGLHYSKGELRYPPIVNGPSNARTSGNGLSDFSTQGMKLPTDPAIPRRKFSAVPRALKLVARNASADDLEALAKSFGEDEELLPVPEGDLKLVSKNGELPDNLQGHVILAMEGEAPLQSLPMFLKNLWRKDQRTSMKESHRAKVVVVHPSFPDGFREKYEFFEGSSLFLVEGSPSSRATWRKAKLGKASAVAIMADITQDAMSSDARTIFVLLTLDVSTTNDHDLFIISELVDEKSLEYLREPIHARRRGAKLGESVHAAHLHTGDPAATNRQDPHTADHMDLISVGSDQRTRDEDRVERVGSVGTVAESTAPTQERSVAGAGSVRETEDKTVRSNKSDVQEASSRATSKAHQTGLKDKLKSKQLKTPSTAMVAEAKTLDIGPDAHGMSDVLQVGTDPANRPGAARARRSTLFSRSRYASGELLVQSSSITLISREYLEPGFISLITTILGTNTSNPGMKIRLVHIPQSMFNSSTGNVCSQGRPLIRYIDVFLALVNLGVTPLGLYRSGNAPILIPQKKRRKRGEAIVEELGPLLEEAMSHPNMKEILSEYRKSAATGGVVWDLLDRIQNVNPVKRREVEGQEEIHGRGHAKNLYDAASDPDDDDDDFVPVDSDTPANNGDESQSRIHASASAEESRKDHNKNDRVNKPQRWGSIRFGSRNKPDDGYLSDGHLMESGHKINIPGSGRYSVKETAGNLLPYVYAYPDPNSWCSESDGVYILCGSEMDLPSKWMEHCGPNEVNDEDAQD